MKTIEGIVTSMKMIGTAVVETTRYHPHPLYKKRMKTTKKYKADINGIKIAVNNTVRMQEVRPISGGKNFKVISIVQKTSKRDLIGEEKV